MLMARNRVPDDALRVEDGAVDARSRVMRRAAVRVCEHHAAVTAAKAAAHHLFERDVAGAAVRVREGAPIGRSLGQSRLFPPMMIHLISSGETSGELDTMLERAAVHQERELDSILQSVVGLLGPVMILVMGGMVLLIVLAMLMPIFQLNELVR